MQTVIAGAGGLGSVVGGYLAQAGADVTLLGRQAHITAIRERGLRIEGLRGPTLVRALRAVSDPSEVRAADLLILCVKSYDTAEALASLAHLRDRIGVAISFQNGGRKEEELAEAFGREAVVGAATLVGAAMPEPGLVRHTNDGSTWIGELDGRPVPRVEAIEALFRAANLSIEVRPDIRTAIWCKMAQMVAAASMACATRLFLHQILLDRGLAALFVELIREVAGVAGRLGIPLADFRGFAVKTLTTLPFKDAVDSIVTVGRTMRDRGLTQVKISMLQDLERGKRTEADQTLGHVVRLAADLGVPLPKVELLYRIIRGTEAAQRPSPAPA